MAQAELLEDGDGVVRAARAAFQRVGPPSDERFNQALALAVYGSRARGDAEAGSDFDILVVTDHTSSRAVTEGSVSVTFYPRHKLLGLARRGDLFVLHLIHEAKFSYDPTGFAAALRAAFRYRASYRREVLRAAALGWFLVANGHRLDPRLVNRRAAWCVRTILIAEAAQGRNPIFAAEDLANFSGDEATRTILRRKSAADLDVHVLATLALFLRRRGFKPSSRAWRWDIAEYVSHFRRTGNAVGVRTALGQSSHYVPVS